MGDAYVELEKVELESNFKSKKLYQFLSATVAATGTFTLGILLSWSSPALDKIRIDDQFNGVTEDELSWIASLFPVGSIFSGILAGYLLKAVGGQKSMFILCLPSFLAFLLIFFAINVPMIYAGRFILGLCNGAQLILVPIYVSEIAEDSIRGIATAPFAILCSSGVLYVYVVGSIVSWTTLTLISAIFPAVFMVLLFFTPDSPAFLISKGNKIKALENLMWLRGANKMEDVQEELLNIQAKQEEMDAAVVKFRDFFAPEVLKPVMIILTVLTIQQFSGMTCVIFYASRIFEAANTSLDAGLCAIIMGGVNVLFAIVFMFLVEKAGRKCLLIASSAGCALSLFALGSYFYMMQAKMDTSQFSALPLAAMLTYNIAFGIGLGPVPWILLAEVLPQKIVGSASGFALSFTWILAFLITKTFSTFVDLLGEHGSFWMFGAICVLGTIFTIAFVPETKGRRLEEIQNEFKRK